MKLRVQEKGLSARHCAFCKYWYDPTNRAITPLKIVEHGSMVQLLNVNADL